MIPEQLELLEKSRQSLRAALVLNEQGFHGFAASRAYYCMFYIAEAFLLGAGMSYSKHSAVHAAFGEIFVKTGKITPEFHRYLIRGMEIRHLGDYDTEEIDIEESKEQIKRAERFLKLAEEILN